MSFKWYIANVVSGQEFKVADEINRIASKNENIDKAFVPIKKVMKVKRGKKMETLQKLFPGYVFTHLNLSSDVYDNIKAIPKVSGLLGSKVRPNIVPDSEVEAILSKMETEETEESEILFEVGDLVKVTEGPFESFTGSVEGKDESKNILKVSISIFGRPTIVDLHVSKVEKA